MIMMEEMIITYYCIATLIVIAYLLGSIPSAVWIGKKYYGVDIREHGSKNAGTTNMLRVLGKRAALPVFGLDFLKGFVAVTILDLMKYDSFFEGGANEFWFYVCCASPPCWPPCWDTFSPSSPDSGAARASRHAGRRHHGHQRPASPALLRRLDPGADGDALRVALVDGGRMLLPLFTLISPKVMTALPASLPFVIFSFLIALLLLYTHRKNIERLRAGTESKIYIWRPHKHRQ